LHGEKALDWRDLSLGWGERLLDSSFLTLDCGLPEHLVFCLEQAQRQGQFLAPDAFDSLSFFGLCKGLLLPLSGLAGEKASQTFGFQCRDHTPQEREEILRSFLHRSLGLTARQKWGVLLGDPFFGRKPGVKRDSLMHLAASMDLEPRVMALEHLRQLGDVALLFAKKASSRKSEPPLTAAEVLRTLEFLPAAGRVRKFSLLRGLLERMGRLESFCFIRLLQRRAVMEQRYETRKTAHLMAEQFGCEPSAVAHAFALTDEFHVLELLEKEGAAGLDKVRMQPLVPFRPALAGGSCEEISRFPVWVERKYDGIRLLLHKSTDRFGAMLGGAYTRNRLDYSELIPGLEATLRLLPGRNWILDGELHARLLTPEGSRPATVYELTAALQGSQTLSLRYAAFDLLYYEGRDFSALPQSNRRAHLCQTFGQPWLAQLPLALEVAPGQLAHSKEDLNRLYQHFRSQGYEGIVSKNPQGRYKMDQRDGDWAKRKPEITLDLVLLAAVHSISSREKGPMFGSYVLGMRDGVGFVEVGDVAGLDRYRDGEIQNLIMRGGLLTGRTVQRASASGVRPGLELLPAIVVTVRFEGIIRDQVSGRLSLRDPVLVVIRADKAAHEADSVDMLGKLHLRERFN
jgi:DNA ligase-1